MNKSNIKQCFFSKTNDWSYEQEYRILIKSDDEGRYKLNFKDSLFSIIMFKEKDMDLSTQDIFKTDNYKKLKLCCDTFYPNVCIMEYGFFVEERILSLENREKKIWSSKNNNELAELDC